jgi:hypothetical protein
MQRILQLCLFGGDTMTRWWNLSLTYEPKIQPVIDGTIRQTIRKVGKAGKKEEDDLISFHGWTGRPYHSQWSFRTPYKAIWMAEDILIIPTGMLHYHNDKFQKEVNWDSYEMNHLAIYDGIIPPTGKALRDVLFSKNKIPKEGIEAQIIRW